ncbi:MAG: helix-turn-helix domain-containing protein [Bryobacteraceae bacterium]
MALSKQEKDTKRQTVARAVRMLRNRLGYSQPKLARSVGEDLDAGSVSRWERGLLAPQPANREALARLAERHGWNDLAAVFKEPLKEWKTIVFGPAERRLLGLFEIILLNHEFDPGDGAAIPGELYQEVVNAIHAAVKALKRAHAAGEQIQMIGHEQTAAWLNEIGGPRKRKTGTGGNKKGGRADHGSEETQSAR